MRWDLHSPLAWADRLGMLSVPLFGRNRSGRHPGEHAILLDGTEASFLLSSVERLQQQDSEDLLTWAWSSNVAHSFVLENATNRLLVRQWGDPLREEAYSSPSSEDVSLIVQRLREITCSDTRTVVAYALHLFRALRSNLEQRGARPEEVARAFNALLLWLVLSRNRRASSANLRDIFNELNAKKWDFDVRRLTRRVLTFPVEEFYRDFRKQASEQPYRPDVDLMIRHAGGVIYQEAHRELMTPSTSEQQQRLFEDYSLVPDPASRVGSRTVHYTPPECARALALEAIRALNVPFGSVQVLDPACGSGIFMIAAAREMVAKGATRIQLQGFDSSASACEMARFELQYHLRDLKAPRIEYAITHRNSLTEEPWGAQLILMNPPFIAWNDMSEVERTNVSRITEGLSHGPLDMATAFVYRAIKSLSPGGVVGAIVPVSFLGNKANEHIRKEVATNRNLSLRLIGRFSGFKYFADAAVEIAFIVIARDGGTIQPRLVLAPDKNAGDALRRLRKFPSGNVVEPSGDARIDLERGVWTPRSVRTAQLIQSLQDVHTPKLQSLFDVHLGVRTGNDPAFLVMRADFVALPERERQFFQPVAGQDTIHICNISPSQYVFYPYDIAGVPTIESETALRRAVPEYYRKNLMPRRHILEKRHGVRDKWWLLNRRRPAWRTGPQIVSPSFVDIGKFAFDGRGEYIVVKGNLWKWKSDPTLDDSQWIAYVALLNSPAFMLLLSHYSRQVSGKQYQVDAAYSNPVPLPDLTKSRRSVVEKLAEMGREMTDGWFPDINALDEAVAAAYGVPPSNFADARPILDDGKRRETFARLARQCRRETAVLSNPRQIASHPAYQQIVRLGKPTIPYIIAALKSDGGLWFRALSSIAEERPVGLGRSSDTASAIMQWSELARERGWL